MQINMDNMGRGGRYSASSEKSCRCLTDFRRGGCTFYLGNELIKV